MLLEDKKSQKMAVYRNSLKHDHFLIVHESASTKAKKEAIYLALIGAEN